MATLRLLCSCLLAVLASGHVQYFWSGAVTNSSISVIAKASIGDKVHCILSPRVGDAQRLSAVVLHDDSPVSFDFKGLIENMAYVYTFEVNGVIHSKNGRFHTPSSGAFNFTFALSSCARTGSNADVFSAIRNEAPFFFLHTGDLHYANIDTNSLSQFADAYESVLTSPGQAAMFAEMPVAYMWDDHDFGPNNADRTSPSKLAAGMQYRRYVPHYPLRTSDPDDDIGQSFAIGRMFFILMDTASQRDPERLPDETDGSTIKTALGLSQRQWVKEQLLVGSKNFAKVFLVSTFSWIMDDGRKWAGYGTERQDLVDWIHLNNIQNVFMLSGDAHMLAFDDGSHNRWGGFPVFQAASLDSDASCKGGPYSHGAFPGRNQYGLIRVTDNGPGEPVCLELFGKNSAGHVLIHFDTCSPTIGLHNGAGYKCPRKHSKGVYTSYAIAAGIAVLSVLVAVMFFLRKLWLRHKRKHDKDEEGVSMELLASGEPSQAGPIAAPS